MTDERDAEAARWVGETFERFGGAVTRVMEMLWSPWVLLLGRGGLQVSPWPDTPAVAFRVMPGERDHGYGRRTLAFTGVLPEVVRGGVGGVVGLRLPRPFDVEPEPHVFEDAVIRWFVPVRYVLPMPGAGAPVVGGDGFVWLDGMPMASWRRT